MAKKAKLPKTIAGVKIPKAIRRGRLGKFVASPGGQKMLAEALLMAGAAVVGRETLAETKGGGLAGGAASAVSHRRLPQAFAAAIEAFKAALEPPPEPVEPTEKASFEEESAAPAKKKSSVSPGNDHPVTH